ncbi:hypothetical protein KEM52_000577 [Ascosphaera acerosa]|nr:hypothetical protein KEM52_000577 [Ascosphaera acerosa]
MPPFATPAQLDGIAGQLTLDDSSISWSGDEAGREAVRFTNDSIAACWADDGDCGGYRIAILRNGTATADTSASSQPDEAPRLSVLQARTLPQDFVERFSCGHVDRLLRTPTTGSDVHVVVSTAAGTCRATAFYERVLRPLLGLLGVHGYQTHKTESASSILDLASNILFPRADAGAAQTVILLSGDGGLVDLIRAFFAQKRSPQYARPTLAVIPMGTGNATANSTQFRDLTEGLSTLLRGTPRPLPMFSLAVSPGSAYVVDEGRGREPILASPDPHGLDGETQACHLHGAVVLSWGLHASLVADSDTTPYRQYGVDRFKMVAADLLRALDGNPEGHYRGWITVTTRDAATGALEREVLGGESHMYTLVTLVSHLERNYTIAPDSEPLDGQLRLVHIGDVSSQETMRIINLPYQDGRHVAEAGVTYKAIESLRIDFREPDESWRRICVDGQIVAVGVDGWLEVRRSQQELFNLVCAYPPA